MIEQAYPVSRVEDSLKLLNYGVLPCMRGLAPGVALFLEVVGEVGAAEAEMGGEVDEGLGGAIDIEDALLAVAGPLDAGDAGLIGLRE